MKQKTDFVIEYVTIESQYMGTDWTYPKKYEICLDKIIGFEIHWRCGDGWHVSVLTKEKIGEFAFYSYELSHFVYAKEIAQMIANKKIKIISFTNDGSSNFIENLNKVLQLAEKVKIP